MPNAQWNWLELNASSGSNMSSKADGSMHRFAYLMLYANYVAILAFPPFAFCLQASKIVPRFRGLTSASGKCTRWPAADIGILLL